MAFMYYSRKQILRLGAIILLLLLLFPSTISADEGLGLLEAVTLTLSHQPSILIQKQQVEIDRGAYMVASGDFDTELNASASYQHSDQPLSPADEELLNSSNQIINEDFYSLGTTTLLRSGIEISPSISVTNTDISTSDYDSVASGRVDFSILFPLMKGRGEEATAAEEMALKSDLEVSNLTLRHVISEKVLDTVVGYWTYVAAKKQYDQLIASENRAEKMVESTQELIKADEVPAVDIQRMQANLSDKSSGRVIGLQNVIQAQQQMGLTIGLDYSQFDDVKDPTLDFPDLLEESLARLPDRLQSLLDISLAMRTDYQARLKDQQSKQILITAAKNKLKPDLNLNVNFGFSGQDEGRELRSYYSSFSRDIPGISQAISLEYSFRPSNTSAQGVFLQKKAALSQSKIETDDIIRNIYSNVTVTLESVRNQSYALQKAREAVKAYSKAVQSEKEKFLLGMSTLLDIIDTDDRLTDALFKEIDTHLQVAIAIATLRFETGTIVTYADGKYSVDMKTLMSLPDSID